MKSAYLLDPYVAGISVPHLRQAFGKIIKFMFSKSDQYQDSVKMYVSFSNRKGLKGQEHDLLLRLARDSLPLLYLYSKNEVRMEYSELDRSYLIYLEPKEFKEFEEYLEANHLPKKLFFKADNLEHSRKSLFGIIAPPLPKQKKKSLAKK